MLDLILEDCHVTVGRTQPQNGAALLILMSMLTVVPIGLGVGPEVTLEVLVVPDCTALIAALERLAMFAMGEMLKGPELNDAD